jgi:hypothetical protein
MIELATHDVLSADELASVSGGAEYDLREAAGVTVLGGLIGAAADVVMSRRRRAQYGSGPLARPWPFAQLTRDGVVGGWGLDFLYQGTLKHDTK